MDRTTRKEVQKAMAMCQNCAKLASEVTLSNCGKCQNAHYCRRVEF